MHAVLSARMVHRCFGHVHEYCVKAGDGSVAAVEPTSPLHQPSPRLIDACLARHRLNSAGDTAA